MKSSILTKPQIKQIGNILLTKTLGKGTFSKVKLGVHIKTGINVAAKILDKKLANEKESSRIIREITILKKLKHPNIIRLYEVITTNKHIYLIMEYIGGSDLLHYVLEQKKLSENQASKFFKQLISCIEYINSLGITHRDIKPENILLDKQKNNIKLIDFGLSHIITKKNELLKTKCGSPCFVAPEVIKGDTYDGLSADIWSCGIVLYFMLVGKVPFESNDIKVLYSQIISGIFYIPNFLSENASSLLKKILVVDPQKRISLNNIKKHPFLVNDFEKNESEFDSKKFNEKVGIGSQTMYKKYMKNKNNGKLLKFFKNYLTKDNFSKRKKKIINNFYYTPNKNNLYNNFNSVAKKNGNNKSNKLYLNNKKLFSDNNSSTTEEFKDFFHRNYTNNTIDFNRNYSNNFYQKKEFNEKTQIKKSMSKHFCSNNTSPENSIYFSKNKKYKIKSLILMDDNKNYTLKTDSKFDKLNKFENFNLKPKERKFSTINSLRKNVFYKRNNTLNYIPHTLFNSSNNSEKRTEGNKILERNKNILSKKFLKNLLSSSNLYRKKENSKKNNEKIIKYQPPKRTDKINFNEIALINKSLITERADIDKRFVNVKNIITNINIEICSEKKFKTKKNSKSRRKNNLC